MFLLSAYFWAELRLRLDIDYFEWKLLSGLNRITFAHSCSVLNMTIQIAWMQIIFEIYLSVEVVEVWGLRTITRKCHFVTLCRFSNITGLDVRLGERSDSNQSGHGHGMFRHQFQFPVKSQHAVRFPHKYRQDFSSNRKTNIHLSISPKEKT